MGSHPSSRYVPPPRRKGTSSSKASRNRTRTDDELIADITRWQLLIRQAQDVLNRRHAKRDADRRRGAED